MSLLTILTNSLWAALFATGFGVLLATPARALVSCFVCGFMGRFVRDVCMGWGPEPKLGDRRGRCRGCPARCGHRRASRDLPRRADLRSPPARCRCRDVQHDSRPDEGLLVERRGAQRRVGRVDRQHRQSLYRNPGHCSRAWGRHGNRAVRPTRRGRPPVMKPGYSADSTTLESLPRIIIVGGGFGGLAAARASEDRSSPRGPD